MSNTTDSVINKAISILDGAVDACMAIALMLAMLVGCYAVFDSYMVYMKATDRSILKYKPTYEGETPEKPIVGNMVAWLTIKDTTIDYPIMQGTDNTTYLTLDPYGDYSLAGSLFLDARNASDWSDSYSLVYGHHMAYGAMFGALDEYLNEGYLESHTDATLIIDGVERDLSLFSVLETDSSVNEIFDAQNNVNTTFQYIIQNAKFNIYEGRQPLNGTKLVGLSTCKYPDTTERTVVFGWLR